MDNLSFDILLGIVLFLCAVCFLWAIWYSFIEVERERKRRRRDRERLRRLERLHEEEYGYEDEDE